MIACHIALPRIASLMHRRKTETTPKATMQQRDASALFFYEANTNGTRGHGHPITKKKIESGDEGARTPNPRLAKPVLSQLSYVPNSAASKRRPRNGGPESVVAFASLISLNNLRFVCQVEFALLPSPESGRTKIRTWDLVVISDAL